MMLRTGLLALGLAACATAEAQTPAQPSEIFAGLAGSCWKAELADGATDTHCFSVAVGGNLLMDVHKVRNRSGAVVYEGVTTYRPDATSGLVRWDYYNSPGQWMMGFAKRDGDRIRFPDSPELAGDLVWYLGVDAYEVGSAAPTAAKRKFLKVGPTEAGGF